jgi:glutamate-1-semialdehyde 2,1-aminomutase
MTVPPMTGGIASEQSPQAAPEVLGWPVPSEASEGWSRRARRVMPGGVQGEGRRARPYPLYMNRAHGSRIWDVDGNEYVDYHAAFGAVLHGHNAPLVRAALEATLEEHGVAFATAHPLEVMLAERLASILPSAEMSVFPCTGSEATYHALRLARAVTGRRKILKIEGHYHGWHDYVAWSVHFDASTNQGSPVPGSAGMLHGAESSVVVARYNDLDSVSAAIEHHGDELAALILEPVFFNGGVIQPQPGFLEGCRELTTQAGIVLVFDEIISGFRLGLGGAQEHYGVRPDLTTLGKAIANGLPIAAVTGSRRLMSHLAPEGETLFAGTFAGHVLTVGAALACVEAVADPGFHEGLERRGRQLEDGIREALDDTGFPAQILRLGSVWTLYFSRDRLRSYRDIARFAKDKEDDSQDRFRKWMAEHGVYIHPHYMLRGYLTAAHTEDDIARTVEAAAAYFRQHHADSSR